MLRSRSRSFLDNHTVRQQGHVLKAADSPEFMVLGSGFPAGRECSTSAAYREVRRWAPARMVVLLVPGVSGAPRAGTGERLPTCRAGSNPDRPRQRSRGGVSLEWSVGEGGFTGTPSASVTESSIGANPTSPSEKLLSRTVHAPCLRCPPAGPLRPGGCGAVRGHTDAASGGTRTGCAVCAADRGDRMNREERYCHSGWAASR